MPRPRKFRQVCHFPQNLSFAPTDAEEAGEPVILSIDEYEAIRLIDKEGLSQEACGERMKIARTTVQQIYASARRKLAEVIVEGLPLRIEGGDFQLCDGDHAACKMGECFKQRYHTEYEKPKGDNIMRIAVTYENGQIFQHFGHTAEFKVYDIQDGKVASSEVVSTNGSGHGALAGVLTALNADILICGGIGGGAQMALASAGVKLYGGVSGDADKAVEAYLAGELDYDPNVKCDHHGEGHSHEGGCGSHGCGGHH